MDKNPKCRPDPELYRLRPPGFSGPFEPVRTNSHGNARLFRAPLDSHDLSPAPDTNRISGIRVLQPQGQFDRLPGGEELVRLEEYPRGAEIAGYARPVLPFHGQRAPKPGRLPPFLKIRHIF
jgi:hypothetical protein